MSGLDQILEHIGNEAAENARRIIDGAKKEAAHLLDTEKREAERLEQQISKQAQLDVTAASKRIQSAADLKEKRMVLEAKQAQIDEVLSAASAHLLGLEDPAYFEILEKMLDRYATGEAGTIRLSQKDLKRIPADFEKKAAEKKLTLSADPVSIDGGFVLVYGDVEENCSFDALINASKETLQDKIGQILFG